MLNKTKNLVCVLAGLILMYVPASGQEKVEMRTVEVSTLKQDVVLRADVNTSGCDSMITYSETGEKKRKQIYDPLSCFEWENNEWRLRGEWCYQLSFAFIPVSYEMTDLGNGVIFWYPRSYNTGLVRSFGRAYANESIKMDVNAVYDSRKNLTKLEFSGYLIEITYNGKDQPVTINGYNDGVHCCLFEEYVLNYNGGWSLEYKYPDIGRKSLHPHRQSLHVVRIHHIWSVTQTADY